MKNETVAINNYKAGVNDAYSVISQFITKMDQEKKAKTYSVNQIQLMIEAAKFSHMANISSQELGRQFPEKKKSIKKTKKAAKVTK